MSNIDKIRQKIERLKSTNPSEYNYQNAEGYIWALDDLLSFLDTLSEETDEDLEEAAKEYVTTHLRNNEFPTADSAFIAGAEWQKEQMLKDALEGEIEWDNDIKELFVLIPLGDEFKEGQKVKIVIVKEDEK